MWCHAFNLITFCNHNTVQREILWELRIALNW